MILGCTVFNQWAVGQRVHRNRGSKVWTIEQFGKSKQGQFYAVLKPLPGEGDSCVETPLSRLTKVERDE